MTSSSFTILGSSSGSPNPNRACSGYLLQVGESLSLIDCGGGVTSSFLRQGFDPLRLDRVFISHTHSDHVGELALVIQMLHVLNSNRKLTVYLPDEFVEPFESYLNAVYLIKERLRLDLVIEGYSDGFVFDESFRLRAIANSHLVGLEPVIEKLGLVNKMQCHSFEIETGDKRLFYSADIGSFDDIRDCLINLDYALIETTHVDIEQILEHARSSSVKRYVLTHLGTDDEVAKLKSAIAAAGLSNIVVAEDGMRLKL